MAAPVESDAYMYCENDPEWLALAPNAYREPDEVLIEDPPEEIANSVLTLIAGEFAEDVGRIWAGARISDYLTAPDVRRHVWHCWLTSNLAGLERRFRSDPTAASRRLMATKGRNLIEAAYGTCPAGLLQALGKCGPRARSIDFYRALIQALARDDLGAKFIRHSESLSEALVLNVAALPTRLQSKPLFAALRSWTLAPEDFAHFAWAADRIDSMGVAGGIEAIFCADNPLKALHEAFRSLALPTPPWPGDGRLRPVTSQAGLMRAGEALDNCMAYPDSAAQAVSDVLRGRCFFYEWVGDEPGFLRFGNISPLGWVLEDGRGVRNSLLSSGTWLEVQHAFGSWADLAPVRLSSGGRVLGARFFQHQRF